jgi:hypothetical protein
VFGTRTLFPVRGGGGEGDTVNPPPPLHRGGIHDHGKSTISLKNTYSKNNKHVNIPVLDLLHLQQINLFRVTSQLSNLKGTLS